MLFPGAGPDEGGARQGGAATYDPKDTNKNAQRRNRGGHGGACGAVTGPHSRPRSGRPLAWWERASTKPSVIAPRQRGGKDC